MKVVIIRHKGNENYSLGNCLVIDEETGNIVLKKKSLERGWRDNESNVSCIPPGEYTMRQDFSPKFDKYLWEIYGVPGRSECKFHATNYWEELNGCIALGEQHIDINNDGDPDVTSSRNAMAQFEDVLREFENEEIKLDII